MCITTQPAVLSNTRIFVNSVIENGELYNILAYQNVAQSDGPNAMVLPIPSSHEMDSENTIEIPESGKNFLEEYITLLTPVTRFAMKGFSFHKFSRVEVFDTGDYTVVLSQGADPSEVKQALSFVPPDRRPEFNEEVMGSFQELYPGWHLPICCWSGKIKPAPIMWKYRPMDRFVENHFVPGLDAHDGHAPDLNARVSVDHSIVVGTLDSRWISVSFLNSRPGYATFAKYLPSSILGQVNIQGTRDNGDWILPKTGWEPENLGRRFLEREAPR